MITRVKKGPPPPLYLTEWRVFMGISVGTIAEGLKINRSSVWRWENEQHRLNPLKIKQFAELIGVKPAQLWQRPGRRSIDAMLQDKPQEVHDKAVELVQTLVR